VCLRRHHPNPLHLIYTYLINRYCGVLIMVVSFAMFLTLVRMYACSPNMLLQGYILHIQINLWQNDWLDKSNCVECGRQQRVCPKMMSFKICLFRLVCDHDAILCVRFCYLLWWPFGERVFLCFKKSFFIVYLKKIVCKKL